MEAKQENALAHSLRRYWPAWLAGLILLAGAAGLTTWRIAPHQVPPPCAPGRLLLGAQAYTIQPVKPARDGSYPVPMVQPGIAFWLEGTQDNRVFVLDSANTKVTSGTTVQVKWDDCNSATYLLTGAQMNAMNIQAMVGQSISGITIIARPNGALWGFAMHGELNETQISSIATPDLSEVQAEISLLEVAASPNGSSIQIKISVANTGRATTPITADGLSLVGDGGETAVLQDSQPPLPAKVLSGQTQELLFTFARPVSATATLTILGVDLPIEGY